MKKKQKTLGMGWVIAAVVVGLPVLLISCTEAQEEENLQENQSYVYGYVAEITGNELTYSVIDEEFITSYLEQREPEARDKDVEEELEQRQVKSERPDMSVRPEGVMPSGEGRTSRDGNAGRMSAETVTTLIPVGIIVHTQADTETTFQRLATGDIIKMLVETTEAGEEVITEIWML